MIIETGSRGRDLIYHENVADYFKEHPGLIAAVLEFSKRKSDSNQQKIDGKGFEVSLIQAHSEQKYFKIIIGEQSFFCKYTPARSQRTLGGGTMEYQHLKKGMELLKNKGIEKVRMVDFKLAYEDREKTFFVSKYEQFLQTPLDEYISNLQVSDNPEDKSKIIELEKRFKEIKKVISRLKEWNIAYDASTDELVIYDL